MILDEQFEEALAVARQQVENGAQVIDVNMDEAMLDSKAAMVRFLNLIASEPDIARVPIMIDSSKWDVIEAGLKCVQGKCDRQLDLDEGRRGRVPAPGQAVQALRRGRRRDGVRREGPGRHVRAEDRDLPARLRPADEASRLPGRRTSSSTRTSSRSRPASRSTTTTPSTSSRRASWIRANLPHAKISGGVSNVSFSFRGNDPAREAIHTVFLYHAIKAGLTMGIVNAGMLGVYDDLDARAEGTRRGRRAEPPARRDRADDRVRGDAEGRRQARGGEPRVARRAGRGAARACAGARHHPVDRRGHRGDARRRSPRAAAGRSRSSKGR